MLAVIIIAVAVIIIIAAILLMCFPVEVEIFPLCPALLNGDDYYYVDKEKGECVPGRIYGGVFMPKSSADDLNNYMLYDDKILSNLTTKHPTYAVRVDRNYFVGKKIYSHPPGAYDYPPCPKLDDGSYFYVEPQHEGKTGYFPVISGEVHDGVFTPHTTTYEFNEGSILLDHYYWSKFEGDQLAFFWHRLPEYAKRVSGSYFSLHA